MTCSDRTRGGPRRRWAAVASGLSLVMVLLAPVAADGAEATPGCPDGVIAEDGFVDTAGPMEDVIDCLWHWQITGGTGPDRYSPTRPVTREQMAAFITRLIVRSGGTLPASPLDAFSDDEGSPFESQINQLAAVGVTGGTAPGSFGPTAEVTRAQMAAFITRAYDYRAAQGSLPPLAPGPDAFSDDDGNGLEAAINTAAAAGFTVGYGDGEFRPYVTVRRDHMAAFLTRVLSRLVADGLATVPPAPIPSSFQVSGSGWGHGVGMSQYGAYGMAVDEYSAGQILGHYYSDPALVELPEEKLVRVQVLDGVTETVARASGGKARIRVNGVIAHETAGGGVEITVRAVPAGLEVSVVGEEPWTTTSTSGRVHIEWAATRYYLPDYGVQVNTSLTGAQGTYRHGRLEFKNIGGRVNAVVVVRLSDEYMYGIAEMPSSWPREALRAQAIAARSYAWAGMPTSPRTSCDCHLYDDSRSQNYTGWKKENEAVYGAYWKAAVDSTIGSSGRGWVLTHGGTPVRAYYFSSSGGRTENSEDVWVSALPYTRSVSDPWSLRPANPNAAWSTSISQAAMAAAFGLPDVVNVTIVSRTAGSSAEVLRATSATGATATVSGQTFRLRLGLKSAWITAIER